MLEKGKVEGVECGVKVEEGVKVEAGVGGGVKVEEGVEGGVKGLNDPTTEHGATASVRKPHDMPQSQGAEKSTLPSQTEGYVLQSQNREDHVSPPHTKDHVPTPPQSAQTQSSIALLPCPAQGTTVQGLEVRHSGKPPTKPITMTGKGSALCVHVHVWCEGVHGVRVCMYGEGVHVRVYMYDVRVCMYGVRVCMLCEGVYV